MRKSENLSKYVKMSVISGSLNSSASAQQSRDGKLFLLLQPITVKLPASEKYISFYE